MKYPLPTEPIPQSARKQINEKLLYLIDNDTCAAYDVSKADVFQAYTGRGGLHGLQRSDYNSYAAYSEAKKEAEKGAGVYARASVPVCCGLPAHWAG